MRLYVETNFILELAYQQEQNAAADELLGMAGVGGSVSVRVPSFCLAEAVYGLNGRTGRRTVFFETLLAQAKELRRSAAHDALAADVDALGARLAGVNNAEQVRLDDALARILRVGAVLPLDADVHAGAQRYRGDLGLTPTDAIVFASVMADLARDPVSSEAAIFASRDVRAFNSRLAKQTLRDHGCDYIDGFEAGLSRVRAVLGRPGTGGTP